MYFVVYLLKLKKNVILPTSWVKDVDEHFEKFVNNSINRNQKFRCYYTTNQNLFDEDGRPDDKFKPDFNLDFVENTDGDFDGCFEGKLKAFKLRFNDVLSYVEHHRNIEPAIFNKDRLNEIPIPELVNTDNLNNVQDDADQNSTSQENETVGDDFPLHDSTDQCDDINQTDSEQNQYSDLFANQHEDEILHSEDGNDESDPLYIDTAQFEIKREHFDLIENHAGNSDDIDRLLQDESEAAVSPDTQNVPTGIGTELNETGEKLIEEMVHDDLFIIVGKFGIPKPKGMRFKLLKRENDPFSGNIPFDDTDSGRAYEIDGKLIEIPEKVISKVISWNEGDERMSIAIDKKICQSLLLCLVPKDQFLKENASGAVLDFIKACLLVRCDGNRNRVKDVKNYKDELFKAQTNN